MTENALVTKYRPQSFKQVIGQNEIVKSLKQILKKDSSHAFLLIGASGLGKTTIARIIALELGAINPGDITEVDSGQFTGIDDIRNLILGLKYKPIGTSTVKVVILNEAHRLTIAAQDALLTTLEEPIPSVYFVLTTTEGGKIRPAIKTRCTTYELKPVSSNTLFDLLASIADSEQLSISDNVLDLCAKESGGSPRQAIANLAICADTTDRETAVRLLKSAQTEDREAIELCRILMKPCDWAQIAPILKGLEGQNPESIRQVCRAYMEKVILDASSAQVITRALTILDSFGTTFESNSGLTPVIIAVGRIIYG